MRELSKEEMIATEGGHGGPLAFFNAVVSALPQILEFIVGLFTLFNPEPAP